MSTERDARLRERFRALHRSGLFVMPNAWDVGSARILASMGFQALATTSLGHAASLGRPDQHVTLEELLAHVAQLSGSVEVPLSVDAEHGFAEDPAGVARTVQLLADAGAAGCSIEDYDPAARRIEDVTVAVERVAAAADAARATGLVLTARAENHLHEIDDFDDTIHRLRAYHDAGADVLYAPRLTDAVRIGRLVDELGAPINVLAMRSGPTVAELAFLGVRRVSTGGALARAAYGALVAAADEIQRDGTWTYLDAAASSEDLDQAFATGRAGRPG